MTPPLLTQPSCVQEDGSWCSAVYGLAGNQWLAMYSDLLIAKPLNIALILAIAFAARYFVHRAISRLTRGNGARTPKLLTPLKERRTDAANAAVLSERRAQR